MPESRGLICAFILDGAGGGTAVDWQGIERWTPSQGKLWIHLDRNDEHTKTWLREHSRIDPVLVESLLERGSRPRATPLRDRQMLLFLRGINLNPGENPINMVSIRMLVGEDRIISVRRQRVFAMEDLGKAIAAGRGPKTIGGFVAAVADTLTNRMRDKLTALRDELGRTESSLDSVDAAPSRPRLIVIQREAITLHRFLAPQRDALGFLASSDMTWLDEGNRLRLRETVDQVTRYVEDLDAGQEHALALHSQISDGLAERMNRNMYVLSLLAAIFLPLDFITGLLGVNVGGVPMTGDPWGFIELCAGLLLLALVLFVLFRYLNWLQPLRGGRRPRSRP